MIRKDTMDAVVELKLLAIVLSLLLGLTGLLMLSLHTRLPRSRTNIIIGYLNAFGSGVMINVALVHMLAHSNEDLSRHLHGHIHWAFTIAGMGYGVVYLCEDVLLAHVARLFRHEISETKLVVHTHAPGVGVHAHGPGAGEASPLLGGHAHESQAHARATRTAFMALSLQAIVSVHSLFEGLGLGAERRYSEVVSILLAVCVHKGVESFVIASAYVRSTLQRAHVVGLMVIFALTTPLGIAVGMGVAKPDESFAVVRGVLVSLAAGTFIYVGTLILKDEDHMGDCAELGKANGLGRFLLWCAGYGAMTLVALWEKD